MRFLVILTTLCFSSVLFSQDATPLLVLKLEVENVDCNRRIASEISKKFNSITKDVAFVSSQSNIHHVFLSSNIKSSNLLEGLDTYHYVDLDVELKIQNLISGDTKTLTLNGIGKSSTECQAIRKAYLNALTSKKNDIKVLLTDFYQSSFSNDCESFIKEADLLNQKSNYRQALALLHSAPPSSACFSKVESLITEIQENIAKQSCEKEIHELTLLVNTKDIYKIKRNINRLLRIPPDAPCVEEAVKISKEIGIILQEQNQKVPEDLNKFNLYIENQNNSSWRQGYIRN